MDYIRFGPGRESLVVAIAPRGSESDPSARENPFCHGLRAARGSPRVVVRKGERGAVYSWKKLHCSSLAPLPARAVAIWSLDSGHWDFEPELFYRSITASAIYSGKSFEELRLEDYELGRDAGKWWIGGTLQVNNERNMAVLPPDSDEETVIDEVYAPLYAQNIVYAQHTPGPPFVDT